MVETTRLLAMLNDTIHILEKNGAVRAKDLFSKYCPSLEITALRTPKITERRWSHVQVPKVPDFSV